MSTTAASNTSTGGVSTAEGCAPSTVNDAQRAAVAMTLGALKSVTAGGTDTYTATLAPVPDALSDSMEVRVRFTNANTSTTPTLNINSLGAKTIKKLGAAALVAGDIPAAHDAILRYVSASTYWQLLNPASPTITDATNGGIAVAGTPSARTLAVDVSDLTADSSPDLNADYLATYDVSGTTTKKALITKVVRIAQVVTTESGASTTGTTVLPTDDTIPQNTEGDEYMTRAITPTSASSTLIINVVFFGVHSGGGALSIALFQDTTANALAATSILIASNGTTLTLTHKMTAGTTSATTFKVRAGGSVSGTTTFNGIGGSRIFGGVAASSIVITEVLP